MKILLLDQFGSSEVKNTDILPRIGDTVCWNYKPYPVVSKVILWPNSELTQALGHEDVSAVVMLGM